MWRADGNPNPCTALHKILHPHPPPVRGRFWCRFDPLSCLALGDLKPYKLKDTYKQKVAN